MHLIGTPEVFEHRGPISNWLRRRCSESASNKQLALDLSMAHYGTGCGRQTNGSLVHCRVPSTATTSPQFSPRQQLSVRLHLLRLDHCGANNRNHVRKLTSISTAYWLDMAT